MECPHCGKRNGAHSLPCRTLRRRLYGAGCACAVFSAAVGLVDRAGGPWGLNLPYAVFITTFFFGWALLSWVVERWWE
jgi:hypothetical protein